jgi:hypothetical protein
MATAASNKSAPALKPVKKAPVLHRINGCGTTMLGRYTDTRLMPAFYSLRYFTFFGVPLVPLGVYLVSHPVTANGKPYLYSFSFHAKIRMVDFARTYRSGLAKLFASALFEAAVGIALGIALLLTFVYALAGIGWLVGKK